MQEAEVYIPIISQKYTIDLSRTRTYFIPGYPLDVAVCMKLTRGCTDTFWSGMNWYFLNISLYYYCRSMCVTQMAPQQLMSHYRFKYHPQRSHGMAAQTRRGQHILHLIFKVLRRLPLRYIFEWIKHRIFL